MRNVSGVRVFREVIPRKSATRFMLPGIREKGVILQNVVRHEPIVPEGVSCYSQKLAGIMQGICLCGI